MIDLVTSLLNNSFKVFERLFPDKKTQDAAKLAMLELQQSGQLKLIEQQAKVITSEIQSDSWIAKNWRPLAMLTFLAIILNNYIVAPYLMKHGVGAMILEIPPHMWRLLEYGMGGYIVGRSVEKGIKFWKAK